MRNAVRSREIAEQARQAHDLMVAPLRAVAMQHGYALAVHGSLTRDIDLVVVPWTVEAATVEIVSRALIAEVTRLNGHALVLDNIVNVDPYDFRQRSPEPKPHGRMGWSIHLGGPGAYIDLSIFPPIADAATALHEALEASVAQQQERQRAFDLRKASD